MIGLATGLRLTVLAILAGLLLPSAAVAEEANYLVTKNVYYGDASKPDRDLQALDIYWKDNLKHRPVIIYVHGGGWAFGDKSDVHMKPGFFALHDISFVSMNYRLRWDYDLYQQLEDIVSVVQWVRSKGGEYGLDANRVVLMGHGAGAHLVSLVATNQDLLKGASLPLSSIKAVVSIDAPSFDIPSLMEQGNFLEKRRHRLVFGDSVDVWKNASPASHVSKDKQIPPFALLYVAEDEVTFTQARDFSRKLRDASVNVIMIPGNQKTTQTIDEELGAAKDAPTMALTAFLRATI